MKILFDHNTPLGVRRILANHDVQTAGQMGWAMLSNAAERAGFEIGTVTTARFIPQRSSGSRQIPNLKQVIVRVERGATRHRCR